VAGLGPVKALVLHDALYEVADESATLEQSVVLPSLKVTVPDGLMGVKVPASVTVKVADELVATDPEGTVVKESVAVAAVTFWPPVKVPELLLKLPVESTKLAVTVCGDAATVRLDTAELAAMPLPFRVMAEPRLVPSTTNCTVPVGVAAEPVEVFVTVAVKVTGWLAGEGFTEDVTVTAVEAAVAVPLRSNVCVA
jgi:hypothetical protein